MRRLLNQAANAAARTKGSIFDIVYRRSVTRLGHNQAIGYRPSTVSPDLWLILQQGVRRTGPRRHQTVEANAHLENDRAIPKSRLSDRITEPSAQPTTDAVIFDSAWR